MDDPWGSPWASAPSDTAPKNDPSPSPSPPKNLLSPPPRAFFGSNSNSPAQSPWLEQQGFEEWATPGQVEETAANTAWGSWAEPGLTPRADSPGKQSPIAWPSSAATSPALNPTLRSRSSSVFRHTSLDPWAIESPWLDKNEALTSAPPDQYVAGKNGDGPPAATEVVIHVEEPDSGTGDSEKDTDDREDDTPIKTLANHVEEAAACDSPTLASNLAVETEGHESPSRPSSTFSVESSHGLDRQDSPITSVDEEPTFRPRNNTRKTSAKVSELVGLYDGLARAASEEPPVPERHEVRVSSRERGASQAHINNQDHDTEFSDWEEAARGEQEVMQDSANSVSSDRSSTPKFQFRGVPKHDDSVESNDSQFAAPKAHSIPVQQLIDKFGTIKFEPDLSLLEKAFEGVPESDHNAAQPLDGLSDRVITDSFSTVEERKAWYRISRFGSMRKHDSGDEDNYHRVNWQSSQLHTDTIKVVRRWMEEDSFSGKPTLGGTKRTDAFNWDSSAAPVSLDKVFARKSLAGSRTSFTGPFGHTPSSSISSLNSVLEERKLSQRPRSLIAPSSIATPSASPAMSFGWTSNQPRSATAMSFSSTFRAADLKTVEQEPTTPITPMLPPPLAVRPEQTQSVGNRSSDNDDNIGDDEDDDDDWGEMVFSPTQETFTKSDDSTVPQKAALGSLAPILITPEPKAGLDIDILAANAHAKTQDSKGSQVSESITPVHTASLSSAHSTTPADSSNANVDPWASADFSFFDAPATPATPVAVTPHTAERSMAPLSKYEAPSAFPPNALHLASRIDIQPSVTEVVLGPIEGSDEASGTEIVKQILQNLPDLTYMLQ